MTTECTTERLEFERFRRQRVVGRFDGGELGSDGGGLLLRELAQPAVCTQITLDASSDTADSPRLACASSPFVTFVLASADFRGFRRESPMNPGRPGWPGAV